MQTEEYERMYRLEDSYWWFVGRHRLVTGFLELTYPRRKDLTILDIGCGTGAMSEKLTSHGSVVSADFSELALSFSRKRGLNRLCASDAIHLPFRSESFDVVVAMDILEQVEDDHAAIKEIQRVLKPGGHLGEWGGGYGRHQGDPRGPEARRPPAGNRPRLSLVMEPPRRPPHAPPPL